jgi:hypothetical protein
MIRRERSWGESGEEENKKEKKEKKTLKNEKTKNSISKQAELLFYINPYVYT